MKKRILYMIIGNIIISFGISLGVKMNIGADPGTSFAIGVSNLINVGLGTTSAIINTIIFIPIFFLDKTRFGIGSFANMLGVGYILQILLSLYTFEVPSYLITRMVVLLIGIVCQAIGVALYSTTNLGQHPFDALPIILVNRLHIRYGIARMIQDGTLIIISILLHSTVGIGTVMILIFVGPLVEFFNKYANKLIYSDGK